MATLKLGLKGLTSEALVEKSFNNVDMCALAPWLALPTGFLAAMKTAIEEFQQLSEEVLFNGGRVKFQAKRAKELEVIDFVRKLGAYVQAQSSGDEAKILACGFAVRSKGKPVDGLGQVQNLRPGYTLHTGEVLLLWDPVDHAVNFEVSMTTEPADAKSWSVVTVTSRGRATISGLEPATVYYFRVQAIGRKGLRSPQSQVTKALSAA